MFTVICWAMSDSSPNNIFNIWLVGCGARERVSRRCPYKQLGHKLPLFVGKQTAFITALLSSCEIFGLKMELGRRGVDKPSAVWNIAQYFLFIRNSIFFWIFFSQWQLQIKKKSNTVFVYRLYPFLKLHYLIRKCYLGGSKAVCIY